MSLLLDILTKELGEAVTILPLAPTTVPACEIPRDRFPVAAKFLKKQAHALLAAEWGTDERPFGRGFAVYACFRRAAHYLIVKIAVPADDPAFPSLTKRYVPAYRFERQIFSLLGLKPTGHPDLRPWIKFEDWPANAWPLRKDFDPAQTLPRVPGEYRFGRAEGEGVYEIPVGPVHAGIIEPGHFRFQAMGEDILNLEERLGYVHKGIEKRFEAMTWQAAAALAGRVSGDTTAAHALTYCRALEAMAGIEAPPRAQWLRALFLERERIANHLADIGAICNDVAFAFMLYQMMRLKEILLRTNRSLFGHRLLMDRIVPGGVACDLDPTGIESIRKELEQVEKDFERLVVILDENSSLEDRLRTTGILRAEEARDLGVVGLVARASGMHLDCRVRHPFPPYDRFPVTMKTFSGGDVSARTWVRINEVRESFRLIRDILDSLPGGPIAIEVPAPAAGTTGFAAVEGWRGEILYWLQAGPNGEINRCMVRDPSALSWIGLERCVQGNIVPDFPVCNKSFNQSYSGHDL